MKLSKTALAEIIVILQYGILRGDDISQHLRDLDLVVQEGAILSQTDDIGKLTLSHEYLETHPRGGGLEWTDKVN